MQKVLSKILVNIIIFIGLFFCSSFFSQTIFATDIVGTYSSTTPLSYLLASHVSFSFANRLFTIGRSATTGQSKYGPISAAITSNGNLLNWLSDSNQVPSPLIFHSIAENQNNVYILGGLDENPSGNSY